MDSSIPVAEPPAMPASPVMDVVPPPTTQALADDDFRKPEPQATTTKAASKPTKPTSAKDSPITRQGVGAAIFATVLIVLALSAMATYAYIKTK